VVFCVVEFVLSWSRAEINQQLQAQAQSVGEAERMRVLLEGGKSPDLKGITLMNTYATHLPTSYALA
jgi:hypothetical protein